MNKLLLTFYISFFSFTPLFSQVDSSFLNLYFDSDEYILLQSHKDSLDNFFKKIPSASIQEIILYGHTDSDASEEYNNALSKKRVDGVYQYLEKKDFASILLEKKYFGEFEPIATNENESGKGKNRRVELLLIQKKKKRKIVYVEKTSPPKKEIIPQKKEEKAPILKKQNPCKKDTTLYMEEGVQVVLNQCEYEKIKGCLTIQTYFNMDSLVAQGINTYDSNGSPLFSSGMASIKTSEECSDCFEQPIKVRFLIPQGCQNASFGSLPNVYNDSADGWEISTTEKAKRKTIKRVRYYELSFPCTGMKNLDRKVNCSTISKLKIKKHKNLLSANVISKCPILTNFPLQVKRNGIAKGRLPELDGEFFLVAKYKNKEGEIITIKELIRSSPIVKFIEGKNYCTSHLTFSHFPISKNSSTIFSPEKNPKGFSNYWKDAAYFNSLEYTFHKSRLKKEFSLEWSAGIYDNHSVGSILLENSVLDFKNGIHQVGISSTMGLNSPQFFGAFTSTLFSQIGFGTNLAKLQNSEMLDIIDQKAFNGWGFSSNFGLTIDSPIFWKHWKISLGGTYNITFTKLAKFKTFEPVLVNAEKTHRIKFNSKSKTLMTTVALKYYF